MGVFKLLNGMSSSAQVLRQVDDILHHDMALQEALGLILKVVAGGIGADSSSLLMLSRNREEFVIASSHGLPEDVVKKARLKISDRSVAAWVLRKGEPLLLQGPVRDARFDGASPHIACSIIVPVYLSGACIGVLSVSSRDPQKRFTEEDLQLMRDVGSHTALLIERLRLEERLFKSLEGTRVLDETANKINASRDIPSLFGALAEALRGLIGPDCRSALYLEPPQPPSDGVAAGFSEEALRELQGLSSRLGRQALREQRTFLAFEADPAGGFGNWSRKHGIFAGLALPLRGKGRALGALEVYVPSPYRFPSEEVWALDNLAQLAASALENLLLTSRLETERVRSVQQEKLATLGQLAASIAHEIRNPLSGIIGYTQLLKKSLQGQPHLQDDLEMIERETVRLKQLANSMMTCVRPAESVMVSLNEILDMSLNVLHCEIRHYGARVEKKYGELPPFLCDPGQLEQVFINLLLNALQSVDGQPDRRVTVASRFDAEKQAVEISIADTGCGIRAEDLPRIFEPHFTTRKGGQGNGLGLSLVEGAVERHAGTIKVKSKVSLGTTFNLSFPRRKQP